MKVCDCLYDLGVKGQGQIYLKSACLYGSKNNLLLQPLMKVEYILYTDCLWCVDDNKYSWLRCDVEVKSQGQYM